MSVVEEIVNQASQLPERQRAEVASLLLDTLPGPDYDVSDEEVAERGREFESEESVEISFEELKSGLGR